MVTDSKVQKIFVAFYQLRAERTMKNLNLTKVVSSLTGVVEAAGISMERERGDQHYLSHDEITSQLTGLY